MDIIRLNVHLDYSLCMIYILLFGFEHWSRNLPDQRARSLRFLFKHSFRVYGSCVIAIHEPRDDLHTEWLNL